MASKTRILSLICLTALTFAAGCGDDDDQNPAAPIVDTAPPALPGGLVVNYDPAQQTALVAWNANVTDSDLAGYLVSRGSYDLTPTALVSDPQTANAYEDSDLAGCGRQVTYYVYSVDTNGNVSAAATIAVDREDQVVRSDRNVLQF